MTTRQPFAVIWMALLLSASALAWANELDQAAPLVATPREAEMMDKGYLYYPPRAVRKPGVAKTPEPQALETVPAAPTPTVVLLRVTVASSSRAPPFTWVAPVKVCAPVRAMIPVPTLVKEPAPERMPV